MSGVVTSEIRTTSAFRMAEGNRSMTKRAVKAKVDRKLLAAWYVHEGVGLVTIAKRFGCSVTKIRLLIARMSLQRCGGKK